MVAILAWWALGEERRLRGWVLPLIFAGTALSAVMIEPIYDNTLLYWYPDELPLAFFRAYERTIPWYVPLGYAWFSFCDATGGFVLGAALAKLMPYLSGTRRLWLLILPSFTYASTLGSTTAPASLVLNSAWSPIMTWIAGAATMVMCIIAIHVIAQMAYLRWKSL
ncbi:hypothetical protein RM533_08765 [Croceicoccus sp. F390]|uniref:Uncharacterized protein n=1 Tax=Croceicoccus esteveae TaxID=3075597 RepID=A0ABU2ZI36_9SPHN|nr:hypothetical protein [Croceicoccus sp. F390]MDT0576277.1 hypothetical protein [Croceicoccus sp. F390]